MTPIAKQSVFIILQTETSSRIISKRVTQCSTHSEFAPGLFDNSKTSPQIKCSACETKQREASQTAVGLVNTTAASTARCAFARQGELNKSRRDAESTEVAESKRNENY